MVVNVEITSMRTILISMIQEAGGIVTKSMETNHVNIAKIMWRRVNINAVQINVGRGGGCIYCLLCFPHFFILHLMEMHRRRIDEMLNRGMIPDIIVIQRE